MAQCLFCDKPLPSSERTREHVLPMWLLKATGDPNRLIRTGADLRTGKEWVRPASTFQFPACHACNQQYGRGLEVQARKTIAAIQVGQAITVGNAYRLLDWLDKVRIGLWRGFLSLQKEDDFNPRFAINTRLGRKDRIAIIVVDPADKARGLVFGGIDNNLFRLSQCGLFLRINNIRILSLSADFLLTRETGLPHGVDPYLVAGNPGMVGFDLAAGSYSLSQDWGHLTGLGGTILAQPVIDARLSDPSWALNFYTNSRVLEHAKDTFRASGIEQFLRLIPLQLVSNADGDFRYYSNKRERLRVQARGDARDPSFLRVLYGLMVERGLRSLPQRIKMPDGEMAAWYTGWQLSLDCLYQLRNRLTALGIPFPDSDELVEEIQRVDRLLEEKHAAAVGTLVPERNLMG